MKKDLKALQEAYDAMRTAASKSIGDEQYHKDLLPHYETIRLALHDYLGMNKKPKQIKKELKNESC